MPAVHTTVLATKPQVNKVHSEPNRKRRRACIAARGVLKIDRPSPKKKKSEKMSRTAFLKKVAQPRNSSRQMHRHRPIIFFFCLWEPLKVAPQFLSRNPRRAPPSGGGRSRGALLQQKIGLHNHNSMLSSFGLRTHLSQDSNHISKFCSVATCRDMMLEGESGGSSSFCVTR
jgi:hypothetical protein